MAYIIDGIRVPTGKSGGYYKHILPEKLSAFLITEIIRRNALDPLLIDEVLMANAFGTGGNMARYAALLAGLSPLISATTVDMQCAGGLKSVALAHALIGSGQASCVLAGGMESRSLAPRKAYHENDPDYDAEESGYSIARFTPGQNSDQPLLDAAEKVACREGFSKSELQTWTLRSHRLAEKAWTEGFMNNLAVPFGSMEKDQTIKPDLTTERLARNDAGKLTDFSTAAHQHDGAAVALLVSEAFVRSQGVQPAARIVATASRGCDPDLAPYGIIPATEALLERANIAIEEIDLFEINESFALKPLTFSRKFRVNSEKINVLGGNLAYGHPFGASGTMNLLHLVRGMEVYKKRLGLVAMAAAGGLGMAMLVERTEGI